MGPGAPHHADHFTGLLHAGRMWFTRTGGSRSLPGSHGGHADGERRRTPRGAFLGRACLSVLTIGDATQNDRARSRSPSHERSTRGAPATMLHSQSGDRAVARAVTPRRKVSAAARLRSHRRTGGRRRLLHLRVHGQGGRCCTAAGPWGGRRAVMTRLRGNVCLQVKTFTAARSSRFASPSAQRVKRQSARQNASSVRWQRERSCLTRRSCPQCSGTQRIEMMFARNTLYSSLAT